MFIPDPGSWFLPIPDPGSWIQKHQWKTLVKKNLLSYLFFGVINFTILVYFVLEMLKKKICANFPRIIDFLPEKLSLSSQKYGLGIRDPGKNLFRIPGSKGTGSRIRIRNTAPNHTKFCPLFAWSQLDFSATLDSVSGSLRKLSTLFLLFLGKIFQKLNLEWYRQKLLVGT